MRRRTLFRLGLGCLIGGMTNVATARLAGSGTRRNADGQHRDLLIRGGHVVTMEHVPAEIPGGDVYVRDGIIREIGKSLRVRAAETIDARNMIVMPGLVDTHWHLWNTVLHNAILPGADYFAIKSAFAEHFTAEHCRRSVRLALAQAINAGITTVHNFAHNIRSPGHADAELDAMAQCGIRGRFSYGWRDSMPKSSTSDIQDIARVRRQWFDDASIFGGRIQLGMAMRGFLSADEEAVAAEFRFARDYSLPTVLHTGASKQFGQSVAKLYEAGYVDSSMILVHWIAQNSQDLDAVVRSGASISLSPTSDLRTPRDSSLHHALITLRSVPVNLCLSIDSGLLARACMFEQMSTAWYLGVPWDDTETSGYPPMDGKTLLEMATINGARALGMDNATGSLRVGKRADIVLVRMGDLNLAPVAYPIETLARTATAANVDTVLIDGRILKRNGFLTRLDVDSIIADAQASLTELRRRAGDPWTPAE